MEIITLQLRHTQDGYLIAELGDHRFNLDDHPWMLLEYIQARPHILFMGAMVDDDRIDIKAMLPYVKEKVQEEKEYNEFYRDYINGLNK